MTRRPVSNLQSGLFQVTTVRAIDENDGYFVSRLERSSNLVVIPTIQIRRRQTHQFTKLKQMRETLARLAEGEIQSTIAEETGTTQSMLSLLLNDRQALHLGG